MFTGTGTDPVSTISTATSVLSAANSLPNPTSSDVVGSAAAWSLMGTPPANPVNSISGTPTSPSSAIGIGIGLGLVAVFVVGGLCWLAFQGAKLAYHKYQLGKKKEVVDKARLVNDMLAKIQKDLYIPGLREPINLPMPFEITGSGDDEEVKALCFTDAIIEDMGEVLPDGLSPDFAAYHIYIISAISDGKLYYFAAKGDKRTSSEIQSMNALTLGFITYILYILNTYSMKFSGFKLDIAINTALKELINGFASLKGTSETQEFSRLSDIYSNIEKGIKILDQKSEKQCLMDRTKTIHKDCLRYLIYLLRTLAMLGTTSEHWEFVRNASPAALMSTIWKKKYIKGKKWSLKTSHEKEVEMPDSFFKTCLVKLAHFSFDSLDMNFRLQSIPASSITVPDLERYWTTDKNEMKDLEKLMNQLKKECSISKNFLTRELEIINGIKVLKDITTDKILVDRMEIFKLIEMQITMIISFRILSKELYDGLIALGEIDITNNDHVELYTAIFGMLNKIIENSQMLKKRMDNVVNDSLDNAMQLNNLLEVRRRLEYCNGHICETMDTARTVLQKYFIENRKKNTEELKESAKARLYDISNLLNETYALKQHSTAEIYFGMPQQPAIEQPAIEQPAKKHRRHHRSKSCDVAIKKNVSEDKNAADEKTIVPLTTQSASNSPVTEKKTKDTERKTFRKKKPSDKKYSSDKDESAHTFSNEKKKPSFLKKSASNLRRFSGSDSQAEASINENSAVSQKGSGNLLYKITKAAKRSTGSNPKIYVNDELSMETNEIKQQVEEIIYKKHETSADTAQSNEQPKSVTEINELKKVTEAEGNKQIIIPPTNKKKHKKPVFATPTEEQKYTINKIHNHINKVYTKILAMQPSKRKTLCECLYSSISIEYQKLKNMVDAALSNNQRARLGNIINLFKLALDHFSGYMTNNNLDDIIAIQDLINSKDYIVHIDRHSSSTKRFFNTYVGNLFTTITHTNFFKIHDACQKFCNDPEINLERKGRNHNLI